MEFAYKMAVIIAQGRPPSFEEMYGEDPNGPSSGEWDITGLIVVLVLGGWVPVLAVWAFLHWAVTETFKNWQRRSKAMNARIEMEKEQAEQLDEAHNPSEWGYHRPKRGSLLVSNYRPKKNGRKP